jgi:hypothetical protein
VPHDTSETGRSAGSRGALPTRAAAVAIRKCLWAPRRRFHQTLPPTILGVAGACCRSSCSACCRCAGSSPNC